MDDGNDSSAAPPLPFPLLRRPFRVLVYCRSHHFQGCGRLDRAMRHFIRMPHIYKNSPYSTPLSAPVFFGLTGIRYIFIPLFQRLPKMDPSNWMLLRDQWVVYRDAGGIISYSMKETIEKFASKVEPKIDYKILWWTYRQLDEDTNLEKFFERLPRLCDSKKGKDLMVQEGFIIPHKKRLPSALIGLMDRTLPPNLEAESVKQRRMIICMKVVNSTSLLGPWWFLRCVLLGEWSKFLECI